MHMRANSNYIIQIEEIAEFEKRPFPIEKLFFRGDNKSFTITNPYLIDELFSSMLDYYGFLENVLKKKQTIQRKNALQQR